MDVPQDIVELITGYMDYTTLKKICMVSTTCRDAGIIGIQRLLEVVERKRKLAIWNSEHAREVMRDYSKPVFIFIGPSWT
jgi:hypothetical protein